MLQTETYSSHMSMMKEVFENCHHIQYKNGQNIRHAIHVALKRVKPCCLKIYVCLRKL